MVIKAENAIVNNVFSENAIFEKFTVEKSHAE
jgi:hypothetical protein